MCLASATEIILGAAAALRELRLRARLATRKRAECIARGPVTHVFGDVRDRAAVLVAERVRLTALSAVEGPLRAARAVGEHGPVAARCVGGAIAVDRRGIREPYAASMCGARLA